ncbi:GNAT family N-acetyltransferase [Roseateles sp. NT4]|uniref:GNAT family N-acetyltransferase n=1 Tax=Roseateles sp. NT4 TaxID=3453715 RepID=UPI003EE9D4DC
MSNTLKFKLREVRPTDAAAVVEIHCDPRTNAFRPGGAPSPEEVAAYLPAWCDHWKKHGFGYWAVERDDGAVIGFGGIMLLRIGPYFGTNLYFRLRPDAWGYGLSTAIGRAAFHAAFEVREFDRVFARVRPSNKPSRRSLERLQMGVIDTISDVDGEAPSLLYAIQRETFLIKGLSDGARASLASGVR